MLVRTKRCLMIVCAVGLSGLVAVAADSPAIKANPADSKPSAKQPATESKADPRFPHPKWVVDAATMKPGKKPATRPIEAVERVMIISVDGCRPDLLLRGDTPTLHKLFTGGAYSFWARTTPNSITLPSHTSMLTGVDPRKHGIEWNADLPLFQPVYPKVPTVFYYARKAGYTTGMAAGKSKFDTLDVKGTLTAVEITDKKAGKDDDVAEAAVRIIKNDKPELMFVHLPGNDSAGHKYKWGSPEQMKALAEADAAIAKVLAAAEEAGTLKSTVVIVTADHGGAGGGHGPDDARSRHIPWIASGPGVRAGFDLTFYDDLEIRTEDTFATACWLLGITTARVDGTPVERAFKLPAKELLSEKP